tara:strand:- start:153 stop:356 length:204 start_codon:yes stop_codon:yes gene_type:complete
MDKLIPWAKLERPKAGVHGEVEHSFFYIKRVFSYNKVRYRGLTKSSAQLYTLAGFSNIMMARKYLVT